MKKTLIFIPSFTYGGTTSSLLALLSKLNELNIKADIFCRNHNGPLYDRFSSYNILQENVFLSSYISNKHYILKTFNFFLRLLKYVCKSVFNYDCSRFFAYIGGLQIGTNKYDSIISFQEDLTQIIYGCPSKKRIAYIRCEYERYMEIVKRDETNIYNHIDLIVCVSEFARQSFCNIYPEMIDKTMVINNVVDVEDVNAKSRQVDQLDNRFLTDIFSILSIGRIDPVKQFDYIPEIARIIKQNNKKYVWYIIGDGDRAQIEKIKKLINLYQLEDSVVLLGQKDNVYPYLSKVDLLVHTSKSETFSRVVNDAKVLGTPVLINNYGCATEFVNEGKDGFICPISDMASKIIELMNEPQVLRRIRDYQLEHPYNNNAIMAKFYNII